MQRAWILLALYLVLTLAPPILAQEDGSAEETAQPLEIQISITVLGVSEFQLDNGIYNVDFLLYLECSRICDDEEIGFDVLGVSGSEGLFVEDRGREETSAQYRIRATLAQNMIDLSQYPFDKHQLNIILEAKYYPVDSVVFVTDQAFNQIDEGVRVPGWFLDRNYVLDVTEKTYSSDGSSGFSRITLGIPLSRVAIAAFIRSILPALIILVISFLGTFMPDRQQRVSLAGGILLAMLVHHLSVAGSIPAVAYPVYFDAFMLLNDAAILAQFTATIIELIFERRGTQDSTIDRYGIGALTLIVLLWLIGQAVVLGSFGII